MLLVLSPDELVLAAHLEEHLPPLVHFIVNGGETRGMGGLKLLLQLDAK